jgi:hypothetical protein
MFTLPTLSHPRYIYLKEGQRVKLTIKKDFISNNKWFTVSLSLENENEGKIVKGEGQNPDRKSELLR